METIVFILSVIAGLLILVFLVAVHEFGHGIVARRNGVTVEEFGIGFPPYAWGKKVKQSILGKNVTYSLNWLPIGGFVKLKGEYDSANKKGDYGAASFWAKTKIILAGVATNWIVAALLFTILALVGMPKILPNQFVLSNDNAITRHPLIIGSVADNSPADKAGLKSGDEVVSINEQPELADISSAVATTKKFAGQSITLEYKRDNELKTLNVQLNTPEKAKDGYLGVGFSQLPTTYRSSWSAPIVGLGITGQLSIEIVKGLGDLLSNLGTGIVGKITGNETESQKLDQAGDSVAGPVGIVGKILPGAVNAGIVPVLLITAILSVTLAVMNVLPIPALDGGRWYLMAIFKAIGKPLTKKIEENVNSVGMLILFGLIIVITIADVGKLF